MNTLFLLFLVLIVGLTLLYTFILDYIFLNSKFVQDPNVMQGGALSAAERMAIAAVVNQKQSDNMMWQGIDYLRTAWLTR
jgi:hypothetical protein